MNVFSELVHSVYDLKSYGIFLRDKKRKTFLFGFLLVLIYFLVTIILPFVQFQVSTGGVMKILEEMVPDFRIADNHLSVEKQFELDEDGIYVFIDTKGEGIDPDQAAKYLRRYETVVIADADQLIFKNGSQYQTVFFSDLDGDLEITKDGLMEMFGPFVTMGIGAVLIIVFIFMEAAFFFGVLFVGLFGMIVASCMQSKLTFGELYKLGIYTRTTPLIIKALFSFLPVGLPFYSVISLGISLAYLAGAIRNMDTPSLGGKPVVFYSEGMEPQDRWSRPQDSADPWNRPQEGEDSWRHPGDSQ